MTEDVRVREKPAPLSLRVTLAEQRVLTRRRNVSTRLSVLHQTLRREMGTPRALLWAGGLGFAVGEFTRRPTRAPVKGKRPPAPPITLIDRVMKLVALVRTLSSVFPPADAYPEDTRASA